MVGFWFFLNSIRRLSAGAFFDLIQLKYRNKIERIFESQNSI